MASLTDQAHNLFALAESFVANEIHDQGAAYSLVTALHGLGHEIAALREALTAHTAPPTPSESDIKDAVVNVLDRLLHDGVTIDYPDDLENPDPDVKTPLDVASAVNATIRNAPKPKEK